MAIRANRGYRTGRPVSDSDGRRRRLQPAHALWLACALGGLAQSLAGAAGALLAERVSDSVVAAGLPQTLLVVGSAASALAAGRVGRRFGRATALALGMGTAVAGCGVVVVAGLLDSLAGVLIGCVLLGAGNTAVMLGRYAGADLAPEHARGRAMGAVLVATTVGAVAGPNLLAPSSALAEAIGTRGLLGPYVGAAIGFGAAAAVLMAGLADRSSTPPRAEHAVDGAKGRTIDPPARVGLVVLGIANLVMVSVMTMAPVHLHHGGTDLGVIGLVGSLHIAGMFAPSLLSGRLVDRYGPLPIAAASGVVLTGSCVLAAIGASSTILLGAALALLGVGWNLGLVAGSMLVTVGAAGADRPQREAWGEAGMGVAAAFGGVGSGVAVGVSGYPALAIGAAAVVCAAAALLRGPALIAVRGVEASVRR